MLINCLPRRKIMFRVSPPRSLIQRCTCDGYSRKENETSPARPSRQLSRFGHSINPDEVFGTANRRTSSSNLLCCSQIRSWIDNSGAITPRS
jgi:hypothetical protein